MLPIVVPFHPSLETFSEEFEKVLLSGMVTNNSKFVQELESSIRDYLGVRHCALFCNGETALITMLSAADLAGEVIVPAYTFSGTIHALGWNNLVPVFADVDIDTWT